MGGRLLLRRMMAVGAIASTIMTGTAAAATTLPVDAYGRLPAIADPRFSPDGRSIGYIGIFNGESCLTVIALDTQKHSRLCPGHVDIDWFRWKTNKRVVIGMSSAMRVGVSSASRSGKTNLALRAGLVSAMGLDGGHMVVLGGGKQVVELLNPLDRDPDRILASINDSPDLAIASIDTNTGEARDMGQGVYGASQWIADADGHVLIAGKEHLGKMLWYYRPDERSDFEAIPGDEFKEGGFEPLAVAGGTGLIYVASSFETGRQAIYLIDARNGQVISRYAARPDVDIGGLVFDEGRVVGYTFTDDDEEQVFTAPAWQHDSEVIRRALPGLHVRLLDRTPDGRHVLVLAARPGLPGTVYILSRIPGQPAHLDPVSDIAPFIPDEAVIPARPVTYHASDGLEIHAYLVDPARQGAGPIPFVVMPHGGPFDRNTRAYDYVAQMIASRGYGVLQPNFRGSTGYGQSFEAAGFGEWGRKMQDDVTDATRWLIDQKLADPTRICIVGWSYGGYAALMGAVRSPDLYSCVVSIAGVSDLRPFVAKNRIVDDAVPLFNGDRSLVAENSPDMNADRIRAPVLLIHGASDATVSIEQSTLMEKALRAAGKSVETAYFENDDHNFGIETDRRAMLIRLDGFLERNLGPGVPH